MEKIQRRMTTKTLVSCALLACMNVVLARLMGFMPNEAMRFSIEAVPTFLAGLLFGPVAGAMVGFVGDFTGCMFSPFGYNPIYALPPVLYGLCGGLSRILLVRRFTLPRLCLGWLLPVLFGSVLWQSAVLSYMQFPGSFWKGYVYFLSTRGIQFSITFVLDVLVTWLLYKSRLFHRLGLWKG